MDFNLEESIQILNKTPQVIKELLNGLPEPWIKSNEGPDTWSPFDIVGHFVHGEKTDWIPRAQIILSDNEDKTFIPFDRFAQYEDSKGKSISQLLNEFSKLRKKNIQELKLMNIDKEKLAMKAIHPELGEVTLKELLATWVTHDLNHIYQITRVLAKNYKSEVGPWLEYISVLRA